MRDPQTLPDANFGPSPSSFRITAGGSLQTYALSTLKLRVPRTLFTDSGGGVMWVLPSWIGVKPGGELVWFVRPGRNKGEIRRRERRARSLQIKERWRGDERLAPFRNILGGLSSLLSTRKGERSPTK